VIKAIINLFRKLFSSNDGYQYAQNIDKGCVSGCGRIIAILFFLLLIVTLAITATSTTFQPEPTAVFTPLLATTNQAVRAHRIPTDKSEEVFQVTQPTNIELFSRTSDGIWYLASPVGFTERGWIRHHTINLPPDASSLPLSRSDSGEAIPIPERTTDSFANFTHFPLYITLGLLVLVLVLIEATGRNQFMDVVFTVGGVALIVTPLYPLVFLGQDITNLKPIAGAALILFSSIHGGLDFSPLSFSLSALAYWTLVMGPIPILTSSIPLEEQGNFALILYVTSFVISLLELIVREYTLKDLFSLCALFFTLGITFYFFRDIPVLTAIMVPSLSLLVFTALSRLPLSDQEKKARRNDPQSSTYVDSYLAATNLAIVILVAFIAIA